MTWPYYTSVAVLGAIALAAWLRAQAAFAAAETAWLHAQRAKEAAGASEQRSKAAVAELARLVDVQAALLAEVAAVLGIDGPLPAPARQGSATRPPYVNRPIRAAHAACDFDPEPTAMEGTPWNAR